MMSSLIDRLPHMIPQPVMLDRKPYICLTTPSMMEQWKTNTLNVEAASKAGYDVILIRVDLREKIAFIKNKKLLFEKLNENNYVKIRQSEFLKQVLPKYRMSKRTLKRYKEDGTISFKIINRKHVILEVPRAFIQSSI